MIGKTVSHYRILEKLGEGGMGVVYKAEDTKLRRPAALKFLSPELTRDPEAKRRFIHEARAASALDHPNICTIYEIEETEDGQMFIAMACYEGQTLRERIASGPLKLTDVVDIALRITQGLSKAHSQEIVHRDIKPANLFMTQDGEVKIVDFGLAKLAGQTKLTQAGTTLGTVAYMSPEQTRGEEADVRSDLWALGVALYEMITGVLPFRGEHEQAVIRSILEDEPEPLTGVRSGVPMELDRIVAKCLVKDRDERYQTAQDLAADLRHFQRIEAAPTVPHRPPSAETTRLAAPRTSRRWLPILIGLAAIVVIVLNFMLRGTDEPEITHHAVAVVDFQDLSPTSDLSAAAGMTELVNIGLVENSPIRVVSPEYLHDLRRRSFGAASGPIEKDQALEIARQSKATLFLAGQVGEVGTERFVTWRLVDTRSGNALGARRAVGSRLTELADEIIAEAVAMITSECGIEPQDKPTGVEQITTSSPEAYRHYLSAVSLLEEAQILKAVKELERAVALDSTFALAYLELARLSWGPLSAGGRAKAAGYVDGAWALRSRLGIRDRMRLEAIQYDLDVQPAKEIATYQEMLKRWPDDRQTLSDLQENLFFHWDNQGVVEVTEKALALYPGDPAFETLYRISLEMLGRAEEAIQRDRHDVQENPDKALAWYGLSRRYLALGFPDSAEIAIGKACALEDIEWFGNRDLSRWAYFSGDLDRAISIRQETLKRTDLSTSDREHLTYGGKFNISLGMLYLEAGRYDGLLRICKQAERDSDLNLGQFPVGVGHLLLSIGKAEEVLEMVDQLAALGIPQAGATAAYQRGPALVALGDLEGAKRALEDLYERQGQDWKHALAEGLTLEARIALAENDPDRALKALDGRRQLGLVVIGLDYIEHREATVRAYQMADRPADALRELQDLLRICRGHALGYYELGQIYEKMGRSDDAIREYEKFLEMWSQADEGLPQLVDARERLAALRGKTK